MHKIFTIGLLLICTWSCALGQNVIYLTAYHNSDLYKRSEKTIINFNRFSLALGYETNKWHHVLETSYSSDSQPFRHDSRIPEHQDFNKNYLSVGYELNKNLVKNAKYDFKAGIGFQFYKSKSASTVELPYVPITDEYRGAMLHLIPRFRYNVGKRLAIDVNLRLGIFDVHKFQSTIHNPAIPLREQRWVDETATKILPFTYSIRLGLAYLIKG